MYRPGGFSDDDSDYDDEFDIGFEVILLSSYNKWNINFIPHSIYSVFQDNISKEYNQIMKYGRKNCVVPFVKVI